MSLYNNRSGGSLYWSKNLNGYIKYLFDLSNGIGPEPPIEYDLENSMMATYIVNKELNGAEE